MPNTEGENKSDTVSKTTIAVRKSRANVLLQTACTFAYLVDEELVSVRVFLDNGSQRSYITNDLSAKLGLKPIKRERRTLNTFGSENYNKRECNLI